MIKRGKIKHTTFPFSVGIVTNVTSILGASALDWLFTGKPSSDGLSYPSIEGTGDKAIFREEASLSCFTDPANWPPRDPYDSLRDTWAWEAEQAALPAALDPRLAALQAEDTASEVRLNDDDVPLAHLAQRSVRLRRGSEGFEVRPAFHDDGEDSDSSEPASDNTDWNELYERKEMLYNSGSDDE